MPAKRAPSSDRRLFHGQQIAAIADRVGVPRPLVKRVLDDYRDYLIEQIKEKDEFHILELIKVVKAVNPAKPERPGYDWLHKKPVMFKAKPASVRLRLLPRKRLKAALKLTPDP